MQVTFIAHAGIAITEGDQEILIDPWFTDSTIDHPLIEPIAGYPTIDFQIPKTLDVPSAHTPDAVLISHFHSHHAPHDDIMSLVARSAGTKRTLFGHPDIGERNVAVSNTFAIWPHVEVTPMRGDDTRVVGACSVRARTHTVPNHLAWHIESAAGSVLHIADPVLNTDNAKRVVDEAWEAFRDLAPSVLFINAGGNSLRREKDGVRTVLESGALSPVEAAKVVALIRPRLVSLIGCYNHSVWRNRQEYIPPAGQVEEEFAWALSWLAPEVRFVAAKPGYTYGIGESAGDVLIAVPRHRA